MVVRSMAAAVGRTTSCLPVSVITVRFSGHLLRAETSLQFNTLMFLFLPRLLITLLYKYRRFQVSIEEYFHYHIFAHVTPSVSPSKKFVTNVEKLGQLCPMYTFLIFIQFYYASSSMYVTVCCYSLKIFQEKNLNTK